MENDRRGTSRAEKWLALIVFTAGSAFILHGLLLNPFIARKDWILLVGAILFPILSIVFAFAVLRGWKDDRTEEVMLRALGYAAAAPFICISVLVVSVLLYFVVGWIATIPSSAIIIFLLLRRRPI